MECVDKTDFIKELNEKQIQIYKTFKDNLEVQSKTLLAADLPDHKRSFYLNQNEVIRILIAREFDQKKSLEMWKNWVSWREKNNPESIQEADIIPELKAGKAFQSGYDLQQHPVLVGVLRRHFPNAIPKDITEKFFIYHLQESLRKSREAGSGRVTILLDMTGYTKKNFSTSDSDLIKKLLSILQDNYPESLGKLIVFKPNWLFKLIFAIVKPFLSKRTKEKIILVKKDADLLKYIGQDDLCKEYGGKNTYQYAYPPGSKPINVLEGKVDDTTAEQPENGEDGNVDQNMIE